MYLLPADLEDRATEIFRQTVNTQSHRAENDAAILDRRQLGLQRHEQQGADTGVAAIIVYEFRIRKSKCKRGESKSQFVFREPNIASVAGCIDEWQP